MNVLVNARQQKASQQKTILIVDDTPNNLQLLFTYLKDVGYKVLVAQSGEIALKIAGKILPDLILLDVMMSELDGFETCQRLKSSTQTQNIPVIFMTALAEVASKVKGFSLGAVDYITKPIERLELLARIDTHLTLQTLNRCLTIEAEKQKLLFDISDRIRQSLDLNAIFHTATAEILQFLNCDRLSLVAFTGNEIQIKAQSISEGCQTDRLCSITLQNICPSQEEYQSYLQSKIYTANHTHQTLSSSWGQPVAQLILPIILNSITAKAIGRDPLWGWLIADHCDPRVWQQSEINLLHRLTTQLAIAIGQGTLYQKLRIANKKLKQLALRDPLTKVFNRRYFDRQLDLEWRRLRRMSAPLSLIMCDIDYFKIYNDTYGHQQGDECLRQVAKAIAANLKRPADVLARYGGEEFAIVLPHTPLKGAIEVAEKIGDRVKQLKIPNVNSPVNALVTLSLGVANTIPNTQDSPALLIEAADRALYLAKNRGRNCVAVYQDNLARSKSQQAEELQWNQRIRRALKENLFSLYAQPITSVGSDDGKQHFEILLRLTDIENRVVSPAAFLEIATRNFLMPDIDTWVIEHLLDTLAHCDCQDWHNYRFSINLSGASLNDDNFLNFLVERLTSYHLPPELFCFEITETVAVDNLTKVDKFIKTLRKVGCSFALDDFGKGMSSLTYLKNLSVDFLKIDGSFIKALNQDSVSRAMVEAINNLAGVMGLKTVAEFVENQDILDTLQDLKVDYAQGYYLGRPKRFVDFIV